MKISELNEVANLLPADVDCECVSICNTLNRLPGLTTFESCCGHELHPFWVWFKCSNIDTLSRLGRAVSRTYSDGKWEIVVDTSDTSPKGCFLLRSTSILQNDELYDSLGGLEENILYWFQDEFDTYFEQDGQQDRPDVRLAKSIIDYTVEQLKNGN